VANVNEPPVLAVGAGRETAALAAVLAVGAGRETPALAAVLEATRALLRVKTPAEASAVARRLVADLGGATVPARLATGIAVIVNGDDAVPVDVSFGEAEPTWATAPGSSPEQALLQRHLPVFVRDARQILEMADQVSRLVEDAGVDSVTGLATPRVLGRALGRLEPEDVVIMIDLDHFKVVNDTLGHQEGDDVLHCFGQTLAATVRASDRVGRFGGDEFVVILSNGRAEPFLARLRAQWESDRPHPIAFSAGIARSGPGPRPAVDAADRAMYRAKQAGRDRWQWADEEDYR
jgi:diguanylate cyclase (GGDEF)-like protein